MCFLPEIIICTEKKITFELIYFEMLNAYFVLQKTQWFRYCLFLNCIFRWVVLMTKFTGIGSFTSFSTQLFHTCLGRKVADLLDRITVHFFHTCVCCLAGNLSWRNEYVSHSHGRVFSINLQCTKTYLSQSMCVTNRKKQ